MRRWLVLGLLVSCTPTTDGPGLGEPCDLQTPCGTGGVCDYTVDAPVCLDAAADPDGDGIPNAMDHCPNAPGGLYDEDGDGIGDDCDRCPIAKPPAVPETDGDDVDAPCDPDIHTAGDKILLFDGFSSGTLATTWTASTPSAWTVEGGELVVRLGGQDTQDFLDDERDPVAEPRGPDLVPHRQGRDLVAHAHRVDGGVGHPARRRVELRVRRRQV